MHNTGKKTIGAKERTEKINFIKKEITHLNRYLKDIESYNERFDQEDHLNGAICGALIELYSTAFRVGNMASELRVELKKPS